MTKQCHMYTEGEQCTKPAVYVVSLSPKLNHINSVTKWQTYMCYNHVDLYDRDYYKVSSIQGGKQ